MKSCKNCVYAVFRVKKGKIRGDVAGRCTYRVVLPPIPFATRVQIIDSYGIWFDTGGDCPCWEHRKLRVDPASENDQNGRIS